MKDKELKCNASGYYDEPCYKAILATDVPKPGEIWTHASTGYYMLVVANVNGICSTLRLTDQEKEGSIPVTCKTVMYARPIMLGYSFQQTLGQFVKCIKDEEFRDIQKAIADALGLEDACRTFTVPQKDIKALEESAAEMLEEHRTRDKLLAEYDELLAENKALHCELQAREKANELLRESLTDTSREADKAGIYKEMYMTLLDKVISARGGSANE